eukprot:IDg12226t1
MRATNCTPAVLRSAPVARQADSSQRRLSSPECTWARDTGTVANCNVSTRYSAVSAPHNGTATWTPIQYIHNRRMRLLEMRHRKGDHLDEFEHHPCRLQHDTKLIRSYTALYYCAGHVRDTPPMPLRRVPPIRGINGGRRV